MAFSAAQGFTPQRDEEYLKGENTSLMMQDLVSRSRQSPRALREMDNWVNLNWYAGRPYYRRIPTTATVVGLNPDRRQNFVYANLAFDVVRTISGVMFYEPTAEASPRTEDQEDIARAHVAADLANSIIDGCGLSEAYASVVNMCNIYGHGWIKAPWNPLAGSHRPIFNQKPCPTCRGTAVLYIQGAPKACPQCGAQGVVPAGGPQAPVAAPGFVSEFQGMKPEGNVDFQAVHPDDVYTDPDAKNPGEAEEVCHHMRMSPETAWRCYGEPLGIPYDVFSSAPSANSGQGAYRTSSAVVLMQPTNQRYISVREYYHKPSGQFPMGIFSVSLGEIEIYAGPLGYLHDSKAWHPLFYFPMYETDGMYYPQSTLDLILPLVITYNELLSAKNSRAKLNSRLRMMYAEQSRMRLDDQSGNVVYLHRNGMPQPSPIELAPYPQDAETLAQEIKANIDRISSATDVLRGSAQQGADSARALTFLEEHAVGPLKPIIARHAKVLDTVVKWAVDLCRIFYDDGRMIRLTGETGSQEVFEFRAEEVGESVDVQLKTVRDIGRSRASKLDEITEALKNGGINPEQFQQYAEYGDIDAMYNDRRSHADLAMMENKMLVTQGIMPAPLNYQDHKTHKSVHTKKLVAMQLRNPQDPMIPWLVQHMHGHTSLEAAEFIEPQMAQQAAMANFGAANASNPQFQPAQTQQQVSALPSGSASPPPGAAPAAEPFSNQPPAAPGESAQYSQVAQAARAYDAGPSQG
jgi:hypothetical protein